MRSQQFALARRYVARPGLLEEFDGDHMVGAGFARYVLLTSLVFSSVKAGGVLRM